MTTEVSSSPDVISQALVDQSVEVGAELTVIDTQVGRRQGRDLVTGDERAAPRSDRAKLGDRFAVSSDDEGFACHNRVDHLGVLVAQLALRDSLGHHFECSKKCYTALHSASSGQGSAGRVVVPRGR